MGEQTRGLSANALKGIAIAAMTADHVAWWLFPGYARGLAPLLLHLLGRLTCPIMCYFIAEGFFRTHDVQKYTARLFLFALLSHVPYRLTSMPPGDWAYLLPFSGGGLLNQTSVMWSLAWGLVMLRIAYDDRFSGAAKAILTVLICLAALPADWSCIASLCILALGTNRGKPRQQVLWCLLYVGLYVLVYCLAMDVVYGLLQLGVFWAAPLLARYNGQRGRGGRAARWLFYGYYPLHLLAIGLVRLAGR